MDSPAQAAQRLLRQTTSAALGTSFAGRPYVSLVLSAYHHGALLLMLSDLAQHTRNILADAQVSLLFDGTSGTADPLNGERLTILGQAARDDDADSAAAYLARHPSAALYAGFSDFHLYRVDIERGHLVAGFGRIDWIDGEALRNPPTLGGS